MEYLIECARPGTGGNNKITTVISLGDSAGAHSVLLGDIESFDNTPKVVS